MKLMSLSEMEHDPDAFARRLAKGDTDCEQVRHPGGNPGANLKSISHTCYLREVAFESYLTEIHICLPLGCLNGGDSHHITPTNSQIPDEAREGASRAREVWRRSEARRLAKGDTDCEQV